jgi:hypothetical protein
MADARDDKWTKEGHKEGGIVLKGMSPPDNLMVDDSKERWQAEDRYMDKERS